MYHILNWFISMEGLLNGNNFGGERKRNLDAMKDNTGELAKSEEE
jgi:hypothetical protein